jgi:DNA-binding transcriptional regulator of glucitol operon
MIEYGIFFGALAAAMALQLWSAARQSKAFIAEVHRLRAQGTVAIGLGGRKLVGRKAYVALAARDGRVVDALVLRGLTTFARAKQAPAYAGLSLKKLAGDAAVPGLDAIERQAARQAAQTLNASGGWQPTGGVEQGKESTQPA